MALLGAPLRRFVCVVVAARCSRRTVFAAAFDVPTQSHLHLARSLWHAAVQPGDVVVDATCGRGGDTLSLVDAVLDAEPRRGTEAPHGRVYSMDIDARAVELCRERLRRELAARGDVDAILGRVLSLELQSHERPPPGLAPRSARVVVFNLGFLPRTDGGTTTTASTTLTALNDWALDALCAGGVATLAVYPGHDEGLIESVILTEFAKSLSKTVWRCVEHRALNHAQTAPYLLTLHRLYRDKPRSAPPEELRADFRRADDVEAATAAALEKLAEMQAAR
ncbi:putative rRNA methylase-domain-containing protein [Pelagophyceae sp. CCMP2097]|nr:putative rRNA methylase-domain-containing protein [Pelagophyceae sp. CCMP2097]